MTKRINTEEYEGLTPLTLDHFYNMSHHDWKDVMEEYNGMLEEIKRLRKINEFHMRIDREATKENLKVYEEIGQLTKLSIERYAEIKRLQKAYEVMGEALRENGSDYCEHCLRVYWDATDEVLYHHREGRCLT